MDKNLLLYDGYCNLCSFAVRLVQKHQKGNCIIFLSLQSDAATLLLKQHSIAEVDSIVFYTQGRIYVKSKAVFKVASFLKKPLFYCKFLSFLPVCITDYLYDVLASVRYKLFGKRKSCFLSH